MDTMMKNMLMRNRNPAPNSMFHFPLAIEYPHVHSGGMSAVAMATPGITLLVVSLRVVATAPAKPPAVAMRTSQMAGFVRASSSAVGALMGVSRK